MKCSIFKRTVCFLLIVTFLLGVSMPVFATNEDSHTESIGLNAFFENNYDTTLLDHNATGHMTFVEDMRGKVIGTLAMEVLAMIYGEEPEPNESKYMEVLINIMMTYEMKNASDISEQCKMDTLKTAEGLGMDVVKAGTGLLFELTNVDAAIEPLQDWLNIAVEGLGTIADNTENWIEGIGDLNALLQNYAKHDAFLYQIESLATGELQSAASKLRTAMTSAMKIKLETYSDISETNFQNYSKFFFKDMFFETLKLTEEYATDEGFQFFVELGLDVMDMVGAIDLGIEIGKLVGNVAVNGEDIINRVLEMKAVYDISVVLEHWLKDIKKRISTPYTEAMDNWAIDYVRSGNYLISCRIRGEYCMYSLLAKDSGLYSHFGEKTAQQAENVYNCLTMTLAEIKEQLDGILSVLIVNVGSEMPYEAVNANSQWNVYGSNGQLYDNYTLRIYDKQNLLNFVHTGPMDDPDPTVMEYVADSTEPLVITLEEGYAYTFEFVDNADTERTKVIIVGVTDDDPSVTSIVDVETEFYVTMIHQSDDQLSASKRDLFFLTESPYANHTGYFKIGEYALEGCVDKFLHYNNNAYRIIYYTPDELDEIASFTGDFIHNGEETALTVQTGWDSENSQCVLNINVDSAHRHMKQKVYDLSLATDKEVYRYVIDGKESAYLVCESVEYEHNTLGSGQYYYKSDPYELAEITESINILNMGLHTDQITYIVKYYPDGDDCHIRIIERSGSNTENLFCDLHDDWGKFSSLEDTIAYIKSVLNRYGLADRVFSASSALSNFTPMYITKVIGEPNIVNTDTMDNAALQGTLWVGIPNNMGTWEEAEVRKPIESGDV